jgi:hypothetical protein
MFILYDFNDKNSFIYPGVYREGKMVAKQGPDQHLITKKLKTSLDKTQKFVSTRRKMNSRLLIASMSFSAASTLVAGVTSAGGPVIGSGIEGWRVACTVAAVFGFSATVSSGIKQQLESTDRLSQGKECLTKLKTLDLGITTGRMDWEEIIAEYEKLAVSYPELIS